MLRMRVLGVIRLSAAAAAVAVVSGSAVPAHAASGGADAATAKWHISYSHDYRGALSDAGYWTIVSAGGHDAWAFGGVGDSGPPVAAHAHDGHWKAVSLPSGSAGFVEAASAVSARDIWAVTSAGDVLSWNGSKWRIAKAFNGQLTGVDAFSHGDVWLFGESGLFLGAGTWHLHHGKWTKVTGIAANIAQAGAVSASDMWAVTLATPRTSPHNVLVHYNGSSWRRVRYSAPKGFGLASRYLVVAGRNNVWLLGSVGSTGWLLHLHAGHWSRKRAPIDLALSGAASDGHGGLWAAGSNASGSDFVYHLRSSGRWTAQKIDIHAIAAIPGSAAFLGSGIEVWKSHMDAAVWKIG